MNYKFISSYKINGFAPSPAIQEDEVLMEFPSLKGRILLTYDIGEQLIQLDRATAIGTLMLKGIFGQTSEGTANQKIKDEMAEIRSRRQKEIGNGVFVLFEADGIIDSWNPKSERELDEFIIAFDGVQKKLIYEKYQALIWGVLSSFSLSSDKVYGFEKVSEGVYFIAENQKPIYSYTFKMGTPTLIVSTYLNPEQIAYVKKNGKVLGKHQELTNASRLLVQSLHEKNDKLFSFLSAWSGLEIFIAKVFKSYEAIIFAQLRDAKGIFPKHVERILNVMEDKYRLLDKFSMISNVLAPSEADAEIDLFKKIKDMRDSIMHGNAISLDALPIEKTQSLLRKYLRLHIEKMMV